MSNSPKLNPKTTLAFIHDLAAAGVAWYVAHLLRFNFEIPAPYMLAMLRDLLWIVPLQAAVFWKFGLYRGIWRYASLPDIKRILLAVAVAVVLPPLIMMMLRVTATPRSVLVLDPMLLVFLMAGSRLAYRAWKEHRLYGIMNLEAEPVLVLGAGDAAASLVKELSRGREWRVVGLLDDNPRKHGRLIQGVKVLGALDELPKWAAELSVGMAIIAMPSVNHAVRRRALQLCGAAGVKAMTVPAFSDLVSGKVTVATVRHVELDDLLGRDPVVLDDLGLHELLAGQSVMVTGAGGSIGSELCRQIAKFKPGCLVLFELNEYALYQIEEEFRQRFPDVRVVSAIGDIKNPRRLGEILGQYTPSVLFHAAAYKHVPLMEQQNAWEAIFNNVLGTCRLARAATEHGVKKFVLISTDKAVNPANVMGASKRLAEMVCQALQQEAQTRFVMVRFGNVLGSNGSVIPKFREQIAQGGPVTVTDPAITRYFMSIPEAAQLVLQAGMMGQGGEIFVMEMGEPVRIADLAKDMIRLSGYSEEEIRIVYTGLRPGEKLYEELLADDEHTVATPHPKLRIAQARSVGPQWLAGLLDSLPQQQGATDATAREWLREWVPEYVGGTNRVSSSAGVVRE